MRRQKPIDQSPEHPPGIGDLISYQKDRKGCTAIVGNVERA
jgi:hypothetical protein